LKNVLIDFNKDIVYSLNQKGSKAVSIHTKNNNVIEVIPEAEEFRFLSESRKNDYSFLLDKIKKNRDSNYISTWFRKNKSNV